MSAAVNRRHLLGFAGAGVIAMATPIAARSIREPAGNNAAWDRVRAGFDSTTYAVEEYEKTYMPALQRITDEVGPIPPLSFIHTAESGQTERVEVSLADADGSHPMPCYRAKAQEVAQARQAWIERNSRYENDPRWVAIDARMSALDSDQHHARKALMREPAPDGAALALKLRLALDSDELWDDEREALLADARRMA